MPPENSIQRIGSGSPRSGARARRTIGWAQRICGEKRENVGEHQFLMLLLMIDADLDDARQLRSGCDPARKKLDRALSST